MTDSIKSFTVILDHPIKMNSCRYDQFMAALKLMKNVISITPSINTADDDIALIRAKNELRTQLYKLLR